MKMISLPKIIQGPMSGGATSSSVALIVAVSNAGGLGSLGAGMTPPDMLRKQIKSIREQTKHSFSVNLFVQPQPFPPSLSEITKARQLLIPVVEELGVLPINTFLSSPLPTRWCEDFDQQFNVLLDMKPPVVSFTFGLLQPEHINALHSRDIFVIGTATHLEEAQKWEEVGVDAICCSGIDAGGHRGTFLGDLKQNPQQQNHAITLDFIRQAKGVVKKPLIAAGGIMTGQDIAVALREGATSVQMGTAFLATHESAIHPSYKQALMRASLNTSSETTTTALTRGLTGRYARGLRNKFIDMMLSIENEVPSYPIQNTLTQPLRALASEQNNIEFMSLWCGTGVNKVRNVSVQELMNMLTREIEEFQVTKR